MWHLTAPKHMNCDGCDHPIIRGDLCISDLPEELPKDVIRDHFRHFHLACPQCKSENGTVTPSCYQVFASQLVTERAPQDMLCFNCGESIIAGEPFLQDFFLVRDDGRGKVTYEQGKGPAALIAAINRGRHAQATKLAQFSPETIRKFRIGGLGHGRGIRNTTGTGAFYKTSVPWVIRRQGEYAVRKFIHGKQVSHIESVANAPGKALDPRNVIWESGKANLARGSRNMTRMEVIGVRAGNVVDSIKIVGTTAARNATRGAAWAAVFELPVSMVENGICMYRGKKDRQDALKDSGKNVVVAGATGGVITLGITLAGLSPAIVAAGPVLIPVGLGVFAVSSGARFWKAWKNGLGRVELNFHPANMEGECATSCYESFAEWVGTYPNEGMDVE